MSTLILGLLIFFGMHLIPSVPGFRRMIISKAGEKRYKAIYSISSLLGIILIVYGMSIAVFQPIWSPPAWSKNVVVLTMLFSFYLFAAADMKSNIKRFFRHPMLLGVALWSGTHLLANGDLAAILLFGSFCVFSLLGIFSANIRGAAKQEKVYPFTRDAVTVLVSLVVYGIFVLYLHPHLIGAPII